MARRGMKKKTSRSRRSKTVNLVNVAQSVVVGNAMTMGLFGTNLAEFLTGRIDGKFNPGADGYSKVTLPELLGFTASGFRPGNIGGNFGSRTAGDALAYNFNAHGGKMIATMILAPAAFKIGTKLTAGPRRSANKLLDMSGLKKVVKV